MQSFIEYRKIHGLAKIICKIRIEDFAEAVLESLRFNVYDSTSRVVSATLLNIQGHNDEFVFEYNADAQNYFVKVDFSIRNMTKQFHAFVFFNNTELQHSCTCNNGDNCSESNRDNSEEMEAASKFDREAMAFLADIINPEDRRKAAPLPQIPEEEEFDIEIEKRKS